MSPNLNLQEAETELARIMAEFDSGNKEQLATTLVSDFGLKKNDESFEAQLEQILNRKLTPTESFKIDILERTYSFHHEGGWEKRIWIT